MSVVVRRYIDFLIPTPLASVLYYSIATFCSLKKIILFYFRRRKKKKNAKSRFFSSGGAYVNCAIIAMLYTHLIGNQP